MKKLVGTTLAVLVTLGSTQAIAGGGTADDENDYEGRVEKSDFSYFGFDKQGDKVKGFTAYLFYQCDNGNYFPAMNETKGALKLDGKKFSGKLDLDFAKRRGSLPTSATYKITGKLGKNGTAKGTVEGETRYAPIRARGSNPGKCFTGKLDWKAKKGVDIDAPPLVW